MAYDYDYESDDLLDYYGEAEEVPDKTSTTLKITGSDDTDQAKKQTKKLRIVHNPRPKLDADRMLSDERGLPELLRLGSEILFEPGKEVENMKQTLAMIELWSHKLFPKYTFHDFLTKAEALGKKRAIKTHLHKVRQGMIPY